MKKIAALILTIVTLFSFAAAASADGAGVYTSAVSTQSDTNAPLQAVVDVDIEWGAPITPYWHFTTVRWNPQTHTYDHVTESYWEGNLETYVTVRNHSNIGIQAELEVYYTTGFSYYDYAAASCMKFLAGETRENMSKLTTSGRTVTMVSAVGKTLEQTPQKTLYVALDTENSFLGREYKEAFDACQLRLTISAYGAVG